MATTTGVILDSSIKVVAFQFSVSNRSAMPAFVRQLGQETPEERQKRKGLPPGLLIVPETHDVMIVGFVGQIMGLGYQLVSAIAQDRPDLVPGARPRTRVRYVLIPHQDVVQERPFPERKAMTAGLIETCLNAMWTVKIHLNPYRKDDTEYTGLYCLDIVLGGRQPFCDRNGRPITVRPKGTDGKVIKDATPEPLVPDSLLKLVDGELCVVPNT